MLATAIWIWLYLAFGHVIHTLTVIGGIGLAGFIVGFGFYCLEASTCSGDRAERMNGNIGRMLKKWYYLAIPIVVFATIASLYPDKHDLKYIIGGATAVSILQNEQVQKLPKKVFKALDTFLEGIEDKSSPPTKDEKSKDKTQTTAPKSESKADESKSDPTASVSDMAKSATNAVDQAATVMKQAANAVNSVSNLTDKLSKSLDSNTQEASSK